MTQAQATYAKLALVFLLLVGGFALVFTGKLPADDMFKQVTTAVAALVIALGISGGASGAASVIAAKMKGPLAVLALCFMLGSALACQACTKAQGTEVATVGTNTFICIMNESTKVPLPSPAQMAFDCGLSDASCLLNPTSCVGAQQVVSILDAADARATRIAAAKAAGK